MMFGDKFGIICTNPRKGIRYVVIREYKGQHTLKVKMKSVPAKMLDNLHGPYKTESAAKAAYSRMYQPDKYWEKPKWRIVKDGD